MDETDKKILMELQGNSNQNTTKLSKTLNIPRTTINNRIRKLEKERVIERYKAVLNWKNAGKSVCALIHIVISSKESVYDVAERLRKMKNVEEIFVTAGQFDIIAKVRLKTNDELAEFIFDPKAGLRSLPSIERTESMIVLDTVKENGTLSL